MSTNPALGLNQRLTPAETWVTCLLRGLRHRFTLVWTWVTCFVYGLRQVYLVKIAVTCTFWRQTEVDPCKKWDNLSFLENETEVYLGNSLGNLFCMRIETMVYLGKVHAQLELRKEMENDTLMFLDPLKLFVCINVLIQNLIFGVGQKIWEYKKDIRNLEYTQKIDYFRRWFHKFWDTQVKVIAWWGIFTSIRTKLELLICHN